MLDTTRIQVSCIWPLVLCNIDFLSVRSSTEGINCINKPISFRGVQIPVCWLRLCHRWAVLREGGVLWKTDINAHPLFTQHPVRTTSTRAGRTKSKCVQSQSLESNTHSVALCLNPTGTISITNESPMGPPHVKSHRLAQCVRHTNILHMCTRIV